MDTPAWIALLIAISLCFFPSIRGSLDRHGKLRDIPTVGPCGILTSYIGALRFLFHGKEMLQDGRNKFHNAIFKVPTLKSWLILVSNRKMIEEMRRAPDDVLSSTEANKELFSTDITLGTEQFYDTFHVEAVKGPLTRNIAARFPDVHDELVLACNEFIPCKGQEWTRIKAYSAIADIICRASNRLLVGLPLCRDPDWLDLSNRFTLHMGMSFAVLSVTPSILKPIVIPLFRDIPNGIKRATKYLEPLIKEHYEKSAQFGKDWPEKPNDLLTWFFNSMKEVEKERSVSTIVKASLLINFGAIQPTAMTFTYALFELVSRPEYLKPLRDEVEAVIREQGWSKDSVRKLWKMDSFIKEALRVSGFFLVAAMRKTLKDFTFSDGITIPAGSMLGIPYHNANMDEDNYQDPETFDGFRFEKLRKLDGESNKHQIVSLDPSYVLFGLGRHACPGRFFVANEIKVLLAHIILNYDVQSVDGKRPVNWQFGIVGAPNMAAQLEFRRRLGIPNLD